MLVNFKQPTFDPGNSIGNAVHESALDVGRMHRLYTRLLLNCAHKVSA
jgi:hypothetical protein